MRKSVSPCMYNKFFQLWPEDLDQKPDDGKNQGLIRWTNSQRNRGLSSGRTAQGAIVVIVSPRLTYSKFFMKFCLLPHTVKPRIVPPQIVPFWNSAHWQSLITILIISRGNHWKYFTFSIITVHKSWNCWHDNMKITRFRDNLPIIQKK